MKKLIDTNEGPCCIAGNCTNPVRGTLFCSIHAAEANLYETWAKRQIMASTARRYGLTR